MKIIKILKALFTAFIILFISISCETKSGFIDTGISNGVHDCSMYEYFAKDSYNWDSLVVMIDHAGLTPLFKGENPKYKDITFFGPTNHSILRYLLNKFGKDAKVIDMSPEFCHEILMGYIYNKRLMRKDAEFAIKGSLPIEGGSYLFTEGEDIELHMYNSSTDLGDISDAGPIITSMRIISNYNKNLGIASGDIQTRGGVIHSLNYGHTIGDFMTPDILVKLEESTKKD